MHNSPLGNTVAYPERYDPTLLVTVQRSENRQKLGINTDLPFCGADIWNAFELSWLNSKGMPQVARARFIFPCTSIALIESKSFKLYLNSLNQHVFASLNELSNCIHLDLSKAVGAEVEVFLQPFAGMSEVLEVPSGISLDSQDVVCSHYHPEPSLLKPPITSDLYEAILDEVLFTDLFRSLCPITGQPDWATITVCYQGPQIHHASLLCYLVSYRLHNDFHENCVERIFCDILKECRPHSLSVEANFLRRGGLDINPVRATFDSMDYLLFPRYNRQ